MKSMNIDFNSLTAIDVGANIGNHTSIFAKQFSHVHSFEPNPHTFRLLEFNASFEDNVTVYNLGLSSNAGNLILSENPSNYGASSVVYVKTASPKVEIDVRPLDQFHNEFQEIGLIKIDVEGMELHVLHGSMKIIQRDKPVIIFEQHPSEFTVSGETDSISLLRSLGYEIFYFENTKRPNSWFVKRIINIYEIFFGKTIKRSIVSCEHIPPDYYPMLIAVHPRDIKNFSI
jgi:FkbM family methyltransferase